MIGGSARRACVDIKATVEKHMDIIDNVSPAHVLSGCDTVSCLYGIGKGTVLKVLRSEQWSLDKLGVTQEQIDDVMPQCVSSLEADPPVLNPAHYGWSISTHTSKLEPVALPANVLPVPESVLKMIKCGCSSSQPCATARCSCSTAHISCSIF